MQSGTKNTKVLQLTDLQPFVGYWPLFYFLNPIHSRYDTLDGGSALCKASTYIQENTNRINAKTNLCLELDSKPRPQLSSERRQFMPMTAPTATVISKS
jgi:hypothetical protein